MCVSSVLRFLSVVCQHARPTFECYVMGRARENLLAALHGRDGNVLVLAICIGTNTLEVITDIRGKVESGRVFGVQALQKLAEEMATSRKAWWVSACATHIAKPINRH